MITPAYNLTATERVLPRMALDFTTGVLDSRVTVARLLNTATRVNASGLVEIVNANLPRFDYNPVTLAPKGLLIEEARTNLLTYSEQFDNAAWVKNNSTITANAAVSPDGLTTADKLVEAASTASHFVRFLGGGVVVAAAPYTMSVWLKASGRNWARIMWNGTSSQAAYFNLATGVVGTVGASTTASITDFGNGWYRCSITTSPLSTSTAYEVYTSVDGTTTSYAGDGTSGVLIWGADAEAGSFATSYIPTTTLAVLRNADVGSMTGTNLTSWCDVTKGTILSEYTVAQFNAANTIFAYSLGSAAAAEIYAGIQTTGSNQFTVANTTNQANFGGFAAGSLNVPQKVCGFYQANNFAASANGIAGGTDISGSLPTINKLVFGARNDGARALNGWVRKFSYWPFPLTTAEVTAFSKQ